MSGIDSIDQSKLSNVGHISIHTLYAGRYRKVRVRVRRLGETDAGLSAGAKIGDWRPVA